MQLSWLAIMAVLFTAVAAKSTASTSSATTTTSAKDSSSSSSASAKPTKNAAAGKAQNNPFAFIREFGATWLKRDNSLIAMGRNQIGFRQPGSDTGVRRTS
ncbi:uncharacterized protein BDW43DRAFT_309306 [Aspergillus alliaceus]|uniref:uncharacterized protein n=1 Tax=Petromyces alliaceus TaxID=209559 RepID=UPI0012A3CDCA|nr:uncharacterized protein BDW43DRAFT_309306 [Aspergillus alliaceus]KAB8235440.1 hypothetical protein BDW43DRAFT_309306 [Aspergillus alliaceus]